MIDTAPPQKDIRPKGPVSQGDGHHCSLLIFAPRNAVSVLINDLTGGYGYTHLAIDCGDIDTPTGKPVMIEGTVGRGVHYGFQDEYGQRKFVRIPLEKAGVNPAEFCSCIYAKLGEKYDNEEALTLGLLDDPAKQICSDLVTVCLPEAMLLDIAQHHQSGFLHQLSAVRVYASPGKNLRLFVSPNGFAEYFGAPRGDQLAGLDQLSDPVLPEKQNSRRQSRKH